MPLEDFAELVESLDEEDEVPVASEPFDADQVPGYSEGDYPVWLQAAMDLIIPRDILNKFGSPKSTALNGSYWEISSTFEEDIVAELHRRGLRYRAAR